MPGPEGGRPQPTDTGTRTEVAYVLPRHPAEVDRLDIQHYALLEALGTNHVAAVERPAAILDVGTGTGQWAYDLCQEFPEALVVGLDLVPGKPGSPPNYRAVRANLLSGLPFAGDRFDLVHQRFLFSGVPVTDWPAVIADLVRVCRPGGWIELVEGATRFEPETPAASRLTELMGGLYETRGLDSAGVVFDSLDAYLVTSGVEQVERRTVSIPLGEWGGRLGSLMASDARSLFTRRSPAFAATFGVHTQDCLDLISAAIEEWEQHHSTYSVAVATGRKAG